jgi:MerR family copper efflux transcriptional regulator
MDEFPNFLMPRKIRNSEIRNIGKNSNVDDGLLSLDSSYKGIQMQKITAYMKIQDAADFLGVTPNTLRNWEKEKKVIVYRNPQNKYRLYKKEDLEQLLNSIKPA